jgi:hypothetical protein
MSTLQWAVKILLVLSGTYLAFVALATETRVPATGRPWYRSLNRYGIGAAIAAVVLLIATIVNEYLAAEAATSGSTKLQDQVERLSVNLAASRSLNDEGLAMAREAKAESELFKGMLEATEVVVGRETIFMASIGPQGIFQSKSIRPDEGDRLSWQLQCGNEPKWRAVQTSECTRGAIGSFGGTGSTYSLRSVSGYLTLTGRSPGEPLSYHTAGGHCSAVDAELRAQECVLNVEHIVSGRKLAREEIQKRLGGRMDKAEDDFCRHYRLLHGEPCPTPEQVRSRQETPTSGK